MSLDKKVIADLDKISGTAEEQSFFAQLMSGLMKLMELKKLKYNRVLPVGEYLVDRHEKARMLNFGDGTTIYDSSVVIGDVKVGKNTWIGPNVLLDGSGTLIIGDNCSISAGVQIYTHDSVKWAVSGGEAGYEYGPTVIGDNCYLGPNVVVEKNITIGECSIIGANSLVNRSLPARSKAVGLPAKIIELNGEKVCVGASAATRQDS